MAALSGWDDVAAQAAAFPAPTLQYRPTMGALDYVHSSGRDDMAVLGLHHVTRIVGTQDPLTSGIPIRPRSGLLHPAVRVRQPHRVPDVRVASFTTLTLAADAVAWGTLTLARPAELVSVVATHAAWVRLYATEAARQQDAARAFTEYPAPGVVLTDHAPGVLGAPLGLVISPRVHLVNAASLPTTLLYYSLVNRSGAPAAITWTGTTLPVWS